jgi:hypothetical protein
MLAQQQTQTLGSSSINGLKPSQIRYENALLFFLDRQHAGRQGSQGEVIWGADCRSESRTAAFRCQNVKPS